MKMDKFGIFGWLLIKVLIYNKLAFWEYINEAFSTYSFARFWIINICKIIIVIRNELFLNKMITRI